MAESVEQFVQGLEQSGLISPDNLRAVREKLPPDRQHDAQEIARELVRQEILTTYQVEEAFQGKASDLVLGNYTILDKIGQGGMGQVFKAQHRKMKRLVAIKLLPAAMTSDQAAINRFQREVEAAGKLEHPNIVTAHDADEAAGRHFLVMQYVEGQDLSALVKKDGPLPVEQALSFITQAARGLEYAHRRGVVHRDIKPANLLLDLEGTVKILDMGLARLESAAGAEHTELTGTGQIMGTVDYMAPEQALNTKHADQRADIYSLGITLWYLLTGRAAYGGESVMAKLLAHREQPIPSLQAACPGATPALEAVFTKMVAKKAEDRYQSMSEVVAELERLRTVEAAAAWVSDDHGEDRRLNESSRGTKGSKAASGHPPGRAVATKRPASPVLETTMAMAGSEIETDPKTEQSLVVPDAGSAWWKNWRIPRGRRAVNGGGLRTRLLTACAAGAVALLLAGIVVSLKLKPETVQPLPRTAKGVQGNTVIGERPLLLASAIAPFDAKQALAHQEAWAKHLGTKVEIENSLGMKLRLIPPGEFMMGSPPDEIDALIQSTMGPNLHGWFRSEGPQHRVNLTQAFYLGSYEVTQQQYQEVIGVNPSHYSLTGPGKDAVKDLDTSQHPVDSVSWFDAIEFCNQLSEKEQLSPYYLRDGEAVTVLGGTGYRLPTEAEWEYACRAGTTTRWYFGSNEQDLAKHAWFKSNAGSRTHRVGELAANPFRLYDLYGNVWEWCSDWNDEHTAGAGSAPASAKTGWNRVNRGGVWGGDYAFCRSANRVTIQPAQHGNGLGFRLARTIDATSEALPTTATSESTTEANDTDPVPASANPPPSAIAPFDAKEALAHQEAWAKHLGTKVEVENSLGMKMRLIPPGEFLMGSPQAEIDALVQSTTDQVGQGFFRGEGPRHRVKLTQAFYLGSCEVTQQQCQELMGMNPSHFSVTGQGRDAVKDLDTGQHPVESLTWFNAVDFCNKLSEKEQRIPYYLRNGETVTVLGGSGYRLPTEAEWEYACRAGTATRWSFGDDEQGLVKHAWFGFATGSTTHRVGGLHVNPFGLYDIYGNVMEWCWDCYGEYAAGPASDPTGAETGLMRVYRGGGWGNVSAFCRTALRGNSQPAYRHSGLGFRLAAFPFSQASEPARETGP